MFFSFIGKERLFQWNQMKNIISMILRVYSKLDKLPQVWVNLTMRFKITFELSIFSSHLDDRKKRKFNLERVGQYLQNHNLQKVSRISVTSDWSKLLEQNECLKNSNFIYPQNKELSLVQEHNNLKESIRKLFEKPDTLISLKTQLLYSLDVCELNNRSAFYWHQFDVEERNSTLFSFTVNDNQMYLNEFIPRSENVKFAKFEITGEETSLSQKFPQMKLLHSRFYNDKAMSMLFSYRKERPTANCFAQFPIEPLLSRLTSAKVQKRIAIDPSMPAINLRQLIDPELVRALDISDGNSLAVSGGRKIATIISTSRKKIYHFEMEVDEGDFDEENDVSDNENGAENDGSGPNEYVE